MLQIPIADLKREPIEPVSLNHARREPKTGTGFEAILAATLIDRQPSAEATALAPSVNDTLPRSSFEASPDRQITSQETVTTGNADMLPADPSQAGSTFAPASRNDTAVTTSPLHESEPRHELNPLRFEPKKNKAVEEITVKAEPAIEKKKAGTVKTPTAAEDKRNSEKISDRETVISVINDLAALVKSALDAVSHAGKEKPAAGAPLAEKNQKRETSVLRQKIAEVLEKMELMRKSSADIQTLQPELKKLVARAKELLEQASDRTGDVKGKGPLRETITGIMTRAEKAAEHILERADVTTAKTAALSHRANDNAPVNTAQTVAVTPFKGDTEGKGGEKNDSNQGMNFTLTKNYGQLSATAAKAVKGQASPAAFAHQLDKAMEKAQVMVLDNKNASISVRLYPRELGSLHLSMGMEQGVIMGRFTVETVQARELLLQNLENVRVQLEDSGIAVGAFEVNVSDHHNGFHEENDIFPAKKLSLMAEAADEFEYNSVASHDGAINLVV